LELRLRDETVGAAQEAASAPQHPFLTKLHTVPGTHFWHRFLDHIAYCTRYTYHDALRDKGLGFGVGGLRLKANHLGSTGKVLGLRV
jgi:hypothetical protein